MSHTGQSREPSDSWRSLLPLIENPDTSCQVFVDKYNALFHNFPKIISVKTGTINAISTTRTEKTLDPTIGITLIEEALKAQKNDIVIFLLNDKLLNLDGLTHQDEPFLHFLLRTGKSELFNLALAAYIHNNSALPDKSFYNPHSVTLAIEHGYHQVISMLLKRPGASFTEENAAEWYELAKIQKNAAVQYWLATCFERGQGAPKNQALAVKLYELAAQAGHQDAQFNLGVHFLNEGVYAQSHRYFQMAAEQGDEGAKRGLEKIQLIQFRQQLSQAADEAQWYELAKAQKNPSVQYQLAVELASGTGTPKNIASAVKLYRLAANAGHIDAQYNLGVHFLKEGDDAQSHRYFQMAAEQGDEGAKRGLKEAITRLQQRQSQTASHSSTTFLQQAVLIPSTQQGETPTSEL